MEDHTKLNDFEVQNQIENRKQRLTIIGAVAFGLLIIIGFFGISKVISQFQVHSIAAMLRNMQCRQQGTKDMRCMRIL